MIQGNPSQPTTIPSYRSLLSRDKRPPLDTWNAPGPQENVFVNQFSALIRQHHYQGIHHSTTPRATGSVTGRLVARDEDRNKGTIPMPTFARRPSTMSSPIPVECPQNSMFGQQRQQVSELQVDKFPVHNHFWFWKIRFKNQVMDQRSGDGRFGG